jgi:hypothetical protein
VKDFNLGDSFGIFQTPETNRAKDLLDLYNQLNLPVTSIDERLNTLLKVKWIINEFQNHILSHDISDLIDRESDLLGRNRPIRSMEKLRLRISNLFLEFIETPYFNPRASEFVGIAVKTKTFLH